jgi:hypothetical protein
MNRKRSIRVYPLRNMLQKIFLFHLFIFLFSLHAMGQVSAPCNKMASDGFIIDGQQYSLDLEDSKIGKVYISFFDGFKYRIAICSSTAKKYKIRLYDIEKKLLFSSSCDNYSKSLDVKFKSNIACYIEIAVDEVSNSPQHFAVNIGFKDNVAEK